MPPEFNLIAGIASWSRPNLKYGRYQRLMIKLQANPAFDFHAPIRRLPN